MAASEDPGRDSPGFPVLPPAGEDLVSELRSQMAALRDRVEELERENESLLFQLSRCRCSKEEDARARRSNEVNTTETREPAMTSSADHLITSSINLVEEEDKSVNDSHEEDEDKSADGLHEEDSKCVKPKLREGPDCETRTIHHQAKRYVALKIMYFGQRFYGFASEAQMDPTVESEIFKALKKTMLLLGNKEDAHYSRCGRTDKGVSSTGQVISLYLRSNLKDIGGDIKHKAILTEKFEEEIDYVRVLNRALPKDIRVIGWCPLSTDFHARKSVATLCLYMRQKLTDHKDYVMDAGFGFSREMGKAFRALKKRFSCLSREYRYLFWKGSLDILAMQKAAEKFIGEYDFRNFCKMDAANVNNYRRHIMSFQISSCNQRSDDDELWAMTIRGSAFLWHQIRCMVAMIFMIGQGLESPNVLDMLLDTTKTPRKPQYKMAPELPLVLRFCEFEDLNFICSSGARQALHEHLKSEFQTYMLQAAIFFEALSCLSMPEESSSELWKKKKGHIPLMLRPTEPSYEERRARLNVKVTHKRPLNCPNKHYNEAK